MTRIEVKYTKKCTRDIVFCDICHKEVRDGYSMCSVCERHLCDDCWPTKERVSKTIYVIPCPICRQLPETDYFIIEMEKLWKEREIAEKNMWKIQEIWGKTSLKSNPKLKKSEFKVK
jgi:hypothetical protein